MDQRKQIEYDKRLKRVKTVPFRDEFLIFAWVVFLATVAAVASMSCGVLR